MLIITDAGHGGNDPGASSGGYKEKDWTLDIEKRLNDSLLRNGFDVSRTRKTDVTLEPTKRGNIVKNSGAKYCISVHVNAGGGEGAETIKSIFSKSKLADYILSELVKVGFKKRRAYTRKGSSGKDYYYMHRYTGAVTTVIVECGFIDSSVDRAFLKSSTNRQKIAEAICKGMCKEAGKTYKAKATPKPDAPKGKLYRVQIGAYGVIANAEAQLAKVKKAGFKDAFIKLD